ncbi:Flp pilus assembly protein TadD, contains TPR repeats [Sphingomonas sp. NFR04]|uniref:SPOR domain-containing protein n=1 Tax=Sphingomonas sp. NFR04 TaxID=1566283 RepID=UPI0008EFD703|nr:SPOR domain-containing protein [Sphingomonas sp. NFR04]SFK14192.1 Flp pilus assembly protein TadD, contains TPR repeats [Sphingomonas sp. NFR04]
MISKKHLGIGAFASALLLGAHPALAQTEVVQAHNPDADALATQMRVLAENPRDVEALIAAARLSTRLGDLSGALALLQRAEDIEAANPRIASNRAAVLVRQGRPGEALRMFQQAEQRGVDPREFAADRGFAYDLLGQPLLAQRDYKLALATKRESDVVRRYALSLGISGDRAGAERELDALLRAQDRAAWRDRAFILAMNGDVAGAEKIAGTVLPGAAGKNLLPFFRRIATLGPADRAFAVHFGELTPTPARLADARMAPSLPAYTGPAPVQIAQVAPVAPATTPVRADTRGRRGASTPKTAPVQVARADVAPVARAVPSQPAPQPVVPQPTPTPQPSWQPTPVPQPTPAPRPIVQPIPAPQPEVRHVAPANSPLASIIANIDVPASERSPAPRPTTVAPASKPTVTVRPKPEPKRPVVADEEDAKTAKPAKPGARKGAQVEDEADAKPVKPGTKKGARAEEDADTKPTKPGTKKGAKSADDEDTKPVKGKKPEPKKPDPKKADPERVWVQVASGANESTVDRAWKGVAAKSPRLLKARGGWWMPFKATNRIVTGPFKTSGEAQAFVNKLAGEGVSAFVVTSEAGQKVTKIAP